MQDVWGEWVVQVPTVRVVASAIAEIPNAEITIAPKTTAILRHV
jgi:hypothetical protein